MAYRTLDGIAANTRYKIDDLNPRVQEKIAILRKNARQIEKIQMSEETKTLVRINGKLIEVDADHKPIEPDPQPRPLGKTWQCFCGFKANKRLGMTLHTRTHETPPEGSVCATCGDPAQYTKARGGYSCSQDYKDCHNYGSWLSGRAKAGNALKLARKALDPK